MTLWAPYQGALPPCSSGPQPGTIALANALLDLYPDAFNLGIFNCREVGGGGSWSLHSDGRAFDCGFPLVDGRANPLGLKVVARIKPVAGELGVMEAIFNRVRWSDDYPNGIYYSGADPHTSHVHLGQTWHAALTLTPDTAKRLLAGAGGEGEDHEPIPPEIPGRPDDEENEMFRPLKIVEEQDNPGGWPLYGYDSRTLFHWRNPTELATDQRFAVLTDDPLQTVLAIEFDRYKSLIARRGGVVAACDDGCRLDPT